ncbi:hypothetical protein BS329_35280 [Amycolatopsis coloradensis]|uniref:Phenyloxazoline synthase MbtB n=1 Tax=Amycolatopsis coloradensis TaxID=76021 RepID=A0A1R0KH69_9PSEU|nr:non-ribosomal peptide synthetase [Amycolatopsis coloradensis]OLZ45015.1 hypothetical protein BS329_35280 [Amycolatopsis coloradensis]
MSGPRRDRLSRLTPAQREQYERRLRGRETAGAPTIRRDGDVPPPLSFGQERLWFVDQLRPGSAAANEYAGLWLRGELDVPALEAALRGVIDRHEALRTTVSVVDGVPVQRIAARSAFELRVLDEPAAPDERLRELAGREASLPFDLERGPLFRALLVRGGATRALLVVTNHHLVGDGWSRRVLIGELAAGYDGTPIAAPPVQYADWAAWQRRTVTEEAIAPALAYWRDRLDGAPPVLELAADRPRPAQPGERGGRVHFRLGAELAEQVTALARAHRATSFMVLLAAWQAVLMRHSGQQDVVVGSPVAGRNLPEVEGVVGMFVNSLVLRTDLSGDPDFAELMARTRETVLGALGHDTVPFERLVRELRPERGADHHPLFQVQFGYRPDDSAAIELPGVSVEQAELDNGTARFDLDLDLTGDSAGVRGVCGFSRDLFDEPTVRRLCDVFAVVLGRVVAEPDASLSWHLRPTDAEQARLDEWNDTAVPVTPADGAVEALRGQCAATPDAVAVDGITYAELGRRVERLAAGLRGAGAGPGTRIGLCLGRGADLVVAMFAVLRSGAAYVPLDPEYPASRLAYIATDAGLEFVVVDRFSRDRAPEDVPLFDLDDVPSAEPLPSSPADPDAPAYVIYTSGSTGAPKGVVVTHANLANFLVAMDREIGTPEAADWLAVTSPSFDISVLELLWTLSRGHRVTLDAGREGPEFSLFYFSGTQSTPGSQQYRLLLDGAKFADEHGFSAVWLPERHFHAFGGSFPAPSVLGAAVASVTERLEIRAGSVVLPLNHPVRVAEEWSVVDNLSDGRVGVSFASGWQTDDFVLDKDSYERRHEVLLTRIEQVRALWRGEPQKFEGPRGRQVEVAMLPRPVRSELPVWLTSSGNIETCRTAGRIGARLLTHLLGQSVEELATKIVAYREAWRAEGHAGEPHVTLMLHTFVGEDAERTRATAWQPFRDYLRSSLGLIENLGRALGMDVRSADFTDDDLEALLDHACARYLDDGALIGGIDQCRALVDRLGAVGVDEIACLIDFGVETDEVLAHLPVLDRLRRSGGSGPRPLTRTIRENGITHLQCTPSRARALLDEPDADALAGLRQWLLGGEALDLDLVRRIAARTDAVVRNMYGPTETTVWSSCDVVDARAPRVSIGRPIANTRLHVLDPHGRSVPVGVPGELHIAGDGVAAGYLNRPELDAERFPADPFAPGRMYRTGDIVRRSPDGRLDYLGRADHQVKLRGFRVEPGEVEAALAALPGIRRAAVAAHGLGTQAAALTAYVVGEPVGDVRAALAAVLPAHLVPSRVVRLDALPSTPNGKLDRNALPAAGGARPELDNAYVAPAAGTETVLAAIWSELLGVDRVGTHDDFFALGGHSLLATQLVARVRRELGADLALRTLFDSPTISALARELTVDGPAVPARPGPVADSAGRHVPFPLTDVQRAYWIGRSGGDVSCHQYLEIELPGMDVDRLESAWHGLVRRHDMLRAIVTPDGEQVVLPAVPDYRIERAELSGPDGAERLAEVRERMSHQVLPSDRWPLFELRASLLAEGRTRLHLSVDTLIADGESLRVLLRELVAVYRGDLDPVPLGLTFRDYLLAQRVDDESRDRALAYWRDRLDTLPAAPELPVRREVAGPTRFVRRAAELDAATWTTLKARAARLRVTPSALLLTAYAQVLGTWSVRDRFTLNLTLFNRHGDHRDLPSLVGDFTMLSLFEVDGATTGDFGTRAQRAQRRLWDDLDHRAVTGVQVSRELARHRGGMAEATLPVVFTSELGIGDAGETGLLTELGGTVVHTITQTPQVWLDHQVGEIAGALALTWDAVDALFPPGVLDDMFAAYLALLGGLATEEAAWTDERRSLLPAAQPACYAELNATAGPIPEGLLHQPFLAQAALRPDRQAVITPTGGLTYAELDRVSAAVAHQVLATGAEVVGVLLERGWRQVAAVLGVLRAGAAYLPLDIGLPPARIELIVRRAGATAVIVSERDVAVGNVSRITCPATVPDAVDPVPESSAEPGDLAYIIYTSGSTGEPKGVLIDHRGALNTVVDINERFGIRPDDRIFGSSALSFDLSVYDVFGTLAAGATLVLPGPGQQRDPAAWAAAVREHRVTVWNSVPALMELLLAHGSRVESLRLVLLSGDWIPVGLPGQIRAHAGEVEIVGLGGATEASIWSVLHPIGEVDSSWTSIPYGRPMRNQSMHVLDESLRAKPFWVPGDLYIGGIGVALGYRDAPELTAAAFVTHPVTGERLYRTGDLARHRPDGTLEFLGREDSQVKVRGMRIELGEIESVLAGDPRVAEAAVIVQGEGDTARLAGYVVAAEVARVTPTRSDLSGLEARLRRPGVRRDLTASPSTPLVGGTAHAAGDSATAFGGGAVDVRELGELLAALAEHEGTGAPKYGYPSAGGLYPVQAYVVVRPDGVRGLRAGAYYHDPVSHRLIDLAPDGWPDRTSLAENNHTLYDGAGFAVFLVSRPSAIAPVYAGHAERFCLLEAGAMAQVLRTRAKAAGVALCPVGDVGYAPLRTALRLEEDQVLLHSLLGGTPVGVRTLEEELRAALAERLPDYMVPQRIHVLEALRLTANGKVDRQALADPARAAAPEPVVVTAPVAGTTTDRLVRMWRDVLGIEEVGPSENFFDLGANSVHLVRVQRRITEAFGRELSLVELFELPTIQALASALDHAPAPVETADVAARADLRRGHRARRRDARGTA